MIAHVGIQVSDIERSKKFYPQALKPIGYQMLREYESPRIALRLAQGSAKPRARTFGFMKARRPQPGNAHIAFLVAKRALVDAFYEAALIAGGKDNRKPGLRPQYSANYYGAFVIDPDGYNIEAMCREAEG